MSIVILISFINAVNKVRRHTLLHCININTQDKTSTFNTHLSGHEKQYLHDPPPPAEAPSGGGARAPVPVLLQLRRHVLLLGRGHHQGLRHPRQRSPGQSPVFERIGESSLILILPFLKIFNRPLYR